VEKSPRISRLRKNTAICCLVITLGILFCTLWPFDPFPPNHVSWVEGANGLRFRPRGVVFALQRLSSAASLSADKSCTLELWIKPAQTDAVSTIVDIYDTHNPRRFLLRQYHGGLIISHDVPRRFRQPQRIKIDVDDGLRRNQLTFITITSSHKGTSVYFDGHLKKNFPRFQLLLDDLSGQLILGSSTVEPDTWSGEIHGFAIYPRELTPDEVTNSHQDWIQSQTPHPLQPNPVLAKYSFSERGGDLVRDAGVTQRDLLIPTIYRVPHHSFLTPPWYEFYPGWDYFADLIRNIVGFMPFGFLICALLSLNPKRHHAILSSTLLGCLLSFCIEVLQSFIPQRGSGVTDIITNTVGTTLGALLVQSDFLWSLFTRLIAGAPADYDS
jgi:VanZ like family/Concanavalin A-like lectin/glucanases superfamily